MWPHYFWANDAILNFLFLSSKCLGLRIVPTRFLYNLKCYVCFLLCLLYGLYISFVKIDQSSEKLCILLWYAYLRYVFKIVVMVFAHEFAKILNRLPRQKLSNIRKNTIRNECVWDSHSLDGFYRKTLRYIMFVGW